MIEIVLVAAVAENGVIGRDNGMPWRLKSDLQRFRALTWGRPVLMGRRTFQSIGKPLPGRTNIVVSRNFAASGVVVAGGLDAALLTARADALRRRVNEIMVIGGAEIYAAMMPRAARLELTRVHAAPSGDAVFPPVDPLLWAEAERSPQPARPHDSAAVTFLTLRRTIAERA
jgi:dihydrofolate reductase